LSLDEEVIPRRTIAYFTRRLQHHLHELVIREFYRLSDNGEMTPGKLAKRLGKDPAQITRWLGAPGNWTLDTWAQLMVGIAVDPRSVLKPLHEKQQYSTVMEAQIASTAPSGGDVTRFAAVDSGHISALAAPGEASFTDSAPL